jgi:hypothetical protein
MESGLFNFRAFVRGIAGQKFARFSPVQTGILRHRVAQKIGREACPATSTVHRVWAPKMGRRAEVYPPALGVGNRVQA